MQSISVSLSPYLQQSLTNTVEVSGVPRSTIIARLLAAYFAGDIKPDIPGLPDPVLGKLSLAQRQPHAQRKRGTGADRG